MNAKKSSTDVARWMYEELKRDNVLWQESVVYEIQERFGDEFAYINDNGNCAIAKGVLQAFNKLTGDDVVWVRPERFWRFREAGDDPGRQQSA